MQDIKAELSKVGTSTMHPLGSIGRYRPNKVASSAASDVSEFLVVVEKHMVHQPIAVKAIKPIVMENYI